MYRVMRILSHMKSYICEKKRYEYDDKSFDGRSMISINDISHVDMDRIFTITREMRNYKQSTLLNLCKGYLYAPHIM